VHTGKITMSKELVQPPTEAVGLGQDPPLTDWLVALSHDSPFEGPQAGGTPAGSPLPMVAVPSLLSLLKDPNRDVRLRGVAALGGRAGGVGRALPTPRAARGEAALHDGDDGVRAEAARALLRAGPQPATEVGALADALQSQVDVVRFHAATALADL